MADFLSTPMALKTGLRSILLNRKTGGAAETMQDVSAKVSWSSSTNPIC